MNVPFKHTRDLIAECKKDRWFWYNLGNAGFFAYAFVMCCMAVLFASLLCPEQSSQIFNTKNILWIAQVLSVIVFFAECMKGRPKHRMSLYSSVLYSKIYVVFGKNKTKTSCIFLLLNLTYEIVHAVVTIKFYHENRVPLFDTIAMVFTSAAALQIVVRIGFSRFYDLTSDEEVAEVVKDEEHSEYKTISWLNNSSSNLPVSLRNILIITAAGSDDERWNWYDTGECFLFTNYALAVIVCTQLIWRVSGCSPTATMGQIFSENLGNLFLLLCLIFFGTERWGELIPSPEVVLADKTYLAFGPYHTHVARTHLKIAVALALMFSSLTIAIYNIGGIDTNTLQNTLLSFLFVICLQILNRYCFSRFFNISDQHGLEKVSDAKTSGEPREKTELEKIMECRDDVPDDEINPALKQHKESDQFAEPVDESKIDENLVNYDGVFNPDTVEDYIEDEVDKEDVKDERMVADECIPEGVDDDVIIITDKGERYLEMIEMQSISNRIENEGDVADFMKMSNLT